MADPKEEERKWMKRKVDAGSSEDPVSPKPPRSPKLLGSPASPPPSALDVKSFRLNYPWISIQSTEENMGKFSCTEFMDIDALSCFMEYVFFSMEGNKDMWYGREGFTLSGERTSKPFHLSFFASLCTLSKAFWSFKKMKKELKQRRDDQKQKEEVKQGQKQMEKSNDEVISTHLQVSDSASSTEGVIYTDQDSPDSASWTEGVIYNHEVKSGRGFADITITGFNKQFLKENGLDPIGQKTVMKAFLARKLRTTAVIELKDDSVFPDGFHAGICQCASYAIHQVTENMDVYKDKPIYLLVCANKNWGVGTLTITGTKQEEREENIFERSLSYRYVSNGDFWLIQSLLRLMLGDKVLQINVEDARKVIEICKDQEKKTLDYLKSWSEHVVYHQLKSWKMEKP